MSITFQINGIVRIYNRHTGKLIKDVKLELWTKTKTVLGEQLFFRALTQQIVWKEAEECYILYNLNTFGYWLRISGENYETVELPVPEENREITVFLDEKEAISAFWGKQWITGKFSKNKKTKQPYYFNIRLRNGGKRVRKIASAGTYRISLPWFETEAIYGRRLYLQGCSQLYQLDGYDFTSGEYQLTNPLLETVQPGQAAELLRPGKSGEILGYQILIDQEMQKRASETEVILVREDGSMKTGMLTEFI